MDDGAAAGLAKPGRDFVGTFVRFFEPGIAPFTAGDSADPERVRLAGSGTAGDRGVRSCDSAGCARVMAGVASIRGYRAEYSTGHLGGRASAACAGSRSLQRHRTQDPQLLWSERVRRHRLRQIRRSARGGDMCRTADAARGGFEGRVRMSMRQQRGGGTDVLAGSRRQPGPWPVFDQRSCRGARWHDSSSGTRDGCH